jgi:hypothetical protein
MIPMGFELVIRVGRFSSPPSGVQQLAIPDVGLDTKRWVESDRVVHPSAGVLHLLASVLDMMKVTD